MKNLKLYLIVTVLFLRSRSRQFLILKTSEMVIVE